jgi:hypothetical protein
MRTGQGKPREHQPAADIAPKTAPGQGPVDPAMRALETYLEASLERLLSGSQASPSGLLVLSAWHEAMPALVHLDPVLEAVDSRVFAVLWLWAREQGRSTLAFPSYEYLIQRTNVQARATVARSLAILRITRWITLCRRVRDGSGRYRGNIYTLHDEPLGLGSSFYLDPGYRPSCRTRPATTMRACARSLKRCSRASGSASMTARMCSQPHPSRKPISASRPSRRSVERAVATSLGSGTGRCRLSDPGGGRWRENHRFTMPSRVSRTEFNIQTRWRQKFYTPTEFKIRTRLYVVVDL